MAKEAPGVSWASVRYVVEKESLIEDGEGIREMAERMERSSG